MANLILQTAASWTNLPTLAAALNSLASGSNGLSEVIDNSTGLFPETLLSLILGSITPSGTPGYLELHVLPITHDGTNYADLGPATWQTNVPVIAGASIKYLRPARLILPPTACKIGIVNQAGVTLASSGNAAKHAPTTYNLNG